MTLENGSRSDGEMAGEPQTRLPWVRWYPKDLLGSSWYQELERGERLLYRELLDHQAARQGRPLPKDPGKLRRLVGWSEADFSVAWSVLAEKFPPVEGGLANRRMAKEIGGCRKKHSKRCLQTAAARGALAAKRATATAAVSVTAAVTAAVTVRQPEPEPEPKKTYTPAVRGLCELLFYEARKWKPGVKVSKDSESTLDGMDKLLRLDKRPGAKVAQVIEWLFRSYEPQNSYDARVNVLSGTSLRKQWDRLENEMDRGSGVPEGNWSGR